MALITDYATLQAAVADYLNREDLNSQIPTFIQLAENRIYRQVRTPANERVVDYDPDSLTDPYDTSTSIQIPTDYLELKMLIYGGRALERISDYEYATRPANQAAGQPERFARVGEYIFFDPPADNAELVELYYYYALNLSDTNPTPPLLLSAPELFLYGALAEASPFLKDDPRVAVWIGLYDRALQDLMDHAWEAELAGSPVTVSNAYEVGYIR